jgi:hypothetical protein
MDGTTAAAAAEKMMELFTMTLGENRQCVHSILNKVHAPPLSKNDHLVDAPILTANGWQGGRAVGEGAAGMRLC